MLKEGFLYKVFIFEPWSLKQPIKIKYKNDLYFYNSLFDTHYFIKTHMITWNVATSKQNTIPDEKNTIKN